MTMGRDFRNRLESSYTHEMIMEPYEVWLARRELQAALGDSCAIEAGDVSQAWKDDREANKMDAQNRASARVANDRAMAAWTAHEQSELM